MTNGVNIDLDASAICLDSSFEVVDVVYFRKLVSDDSSLVHHGDEREGDEIGDDEQISIYLDRMKPEVTYVTFVINSFSGQELDCISKASCHLFYTGTTGNQIVDVGRTSISNNKSLSKRTGLVMLCLFRQSNDWFLRVINEPAIAKVAHQLIPKVKKILQDDPFPCTSPVPDPEIIVTAMPEDVDIIVEPAFSNESQTHNNQNRPDSSNGTQITFKPFIPF